MNDERIRSSQNQWFKRLTRLLESRERKATGLTRVDGARELQRALDAGLEIEILAICPERLRTEEARRAVALAEQRFRPSLLLDENLYERLRFGDRDEGLCAAVHWRPRELDSFEPTERSLLVVLEGVEKPGNLGAVLRTADAAGADALILCDAAIEPSNPNAVRSSLGTLFTVPLIRADASSALAWLERNAVRTLAAMVDAPTVYTAHDLTGPIAVAFGAEQSGLGPVWRGAGVEGMAIPMRGKADSLNLSVSVAIVLYEAVRQRSD